MEIYLVRHGSTEWNRIKKIQGQSDIPLDETGLAMAHQSGLALLKEGIKFDFVFASPLTRAYITAKEFLCGDTSKIRTDDRLKELNFGDYEGHTLEECATLPGSTFENFHPAPEKFFPLGDGETLAQLCERTKNFLQEMIEPLAQIEAVSPAQSEMRIMIAAHGAANKAMMFYMNQETDLANFWGKGLQPNCCITKIRCHVASANEIGKEEGSAEGISKFDSHIVYEIGKDEILYDPELLKKAGNLLG